MSQCCNCMRELHDGFNYCPTCGRLNVPFGAWDRVWRTDRNGAEVVDAITAIDELTNAIRLHDEILFENDNISGYVTAEGKTVTFRLFSKEA